MALKAIPDRRRMDVSLDLSCVFIAVAGGTKLRGRDRDQLDVSNAHHKGHTKDLREAFVSFAVSFSL